MVRVLVIADIHGNLPALEAVLTDPHDVLICLGDIIGYGPAPGACVRRVLDSADFIVRGNHEHALVTNTIVGCPSQLQWLAAATAPLSATQVSAGDQAVIAELPLQASPTIDGIRYDVVHATPSDPLHQHLDRTAPAWTREAWASSGEMVLVGHTHHQFRLNMADRRILNPGSVGQPRDGDPRAAYVIIEDGTISFCRVAYPVERTVAALARCGADPAAVAALTHVLRTGRAPLSPHSSELATSQL